MHIHCPSLAGLLHACLNVLVITARPATLLDEWREGGSKGRREGGEGGVIKRGEIKGEWEGWMDEWMKDRSRGRGRGIEGERQGGRECERGMGEGGGGGVGHAIGYISRERLKVFVLGITHRCICPQDKSFGNLKNNIICHECLQMDSDLEER